MEFSSRMKDYYDLYYLANKFDFDGAILAEALKKTFGNRGHHFTVEQFDQVMAFGGDDAMQKKWKAFCRKIDTKTDDFSTVLRTIQVNLIERYLHSLVQICLFIRTARQIWNSLTAGLSKRVIG